MSYTVLDRFYTYTEVTESELRDALAERIRLDVHHVHAAAEAGESFRIIPQRAIASPDPELILAGSAAAIILRDTLLAKRLQQVIDQLDNSSKRMRAEAAIIYTISPDRGVSHLDGAKELTYFLASNLLLVKWFDAQDVNFILALLRLLAADPSLRNNRSAWNEIAADCVNALLGARQQNAIKPGQAQQIGTAIANLVSDPLFTPDSTLRQELAALRQVY